MRQNLEQVAPGDQPEQFGEVPAQDLIRPEHPEHHRQPHEAAAQRHRVQGAEDAVEAVPADDGAGAAREQVRLARLDPGQNAQARKTLAALLDRREVSADVQRPDPAVAARLETGRASRVAGPPPGEVEVLGKGDRRNADVQRALARPRHRCLTGGVVRPLCMNMVVRRHHAAPSSHVGAPNENPAPRAHLLAPAGRSHRTYFRRPGRPRRPDSTQRTGRERRIRPGRNSA